MSSNGRFKAVLFDLGGTLIKTLDVPKIFRRILEAHEVKVSSDKIAEAHSANQKEFDVEEMVRFGQAFWVKWNLKILERLGIQSRKEFLARKIDELWWEYSGLEVYPDVLETLTQLRIKEIKMGIVTNAFERDFKNILEKVDLADYFDVVVGVDACNKAKPDGEIFLYAVNRLNVRPEETIFVGDSVKHDYEGAKKAGLKPLLINRNEKAFADVEAIKSLNEVLSYF